MKKIIALLLAVLLCAAPALAERQTESTADALTALIEGNLRYLSGEDNPAARAPERREETAENGQAPYAVVITCSDSRVPPEHIFSAGIGDLFVIRTAGNVLDEIAMGSVEYGVEHLRAPLIVVMGHTGCGAVAAAIEGEAHGAIAAITEKIGAAIGEETDARACEQLSALATVEELKANPALNELMEGGELTIACAIYDIESGAVRFLEVK